MAKSVKTAGATTSAAPTVSAQVLGAFVDAIASEKELGPDLAARLRKALIDERTFTETALRNALFGDPEI